MISYSFNDVGGRNLTLGEVTMKTHLNLVEFGSYKVTSCLSLANVIKNGAWLGTQLLDSHTQSCGWSVGL